MLFIVIALGYTGKITIDRDCDLLIHNDPYPPLCTIDLSVGQTFSREFSHSYDGTHSEGRSYLMTSLPDPFTISERLFKKPNNQQSIPHENLSVLFWAFSVIVHDQLVSTVQNYNEVLLSSHNNFESFYRTYSRYDDHGIRQQINYQSAKIDGSFVYGSNQTLMLQMRTFSNGKLHLNHQSISLGPHNALKTLFILEHNFWAGHLSIRHPTWDDEHVFQMTRKIVCGIIQSITFNEYIPTLLGTKLEKNCFDNELATSPKNAQISNEFATGIFSFHYSLAPENIEIRDQRSSQIIGFIPLMDESEPWKYFTSTDVDLGEILLGMRLQFCEDLDTRISDSIRSIRTENGEIFDLGAYLIAKGRDHGLPTYNSLRSHLGDIKPNSWEDISTSSKTRDSLSKSYGDFGWKNIDLISGALSEKKYPNSNVGYVSHQVIKKQFQTLRDTDEHFYLFDAVLLEYKEQIHATTLGKLIAKHTKIDPIKFLSTTSVFVIP